MPKCGSQIILCDVPIRFDTYEGCGHACSYCFVSRKVDISKIKNGESLATLRQWIQGKRTPETAWCDWAIPIHWGGMSDPFQPVERLRKNSLAALQLLEETQYPFIVSTKSALIAEEPYLPLIRKSNCVVQFSVASPRYNNIERGAATYEQRLEAAAKITPYRRVVLRIQPYIPGIFLDVLRAIGKFAEIGIHGVILEGMKYTKPMFPGLVVNGKDFVYPIDTLLPQFKAIKDACHKHGLKFYSGENRLRALGDELCCCGIEGLGWKANTANLNHRLFDPDNFHYTDRMQEKGSAMVFKAIEQDVLSGKEIPLKSFASKMDEYSRKPYPYASQDKIQLTEEQSETLRQYLRACLKASGKKAADVDRHLGTAGMAGHYFGASQWAFPTPEAYDKMRQIMPQLGEYGEVLKSVGAVNWGRPIFAIYGLNGNQD